MYSYEDSYDYKKINRSKTLLTVCLTLNYANYSH